MSSTSPPAYGLQSLEPAHLVPTIAMVVVIGLFFMSFLFILFCRFIFEHASRSNRSIYVDSSSNDDGDNALGLDPVIKEMFPTFRYSTVKSCAKDGLECAICLSEMEDEDMLRLLTVCCHVFHQGCIDKWLGTHATCPICRASLSNPEKRHNMCPALQNNSLQVLGENERHSGDHSVADLSRESDGRFGDDQVTLTIQGGEWAERGSEVFPKAHSTGHSIIFVREEKDDKYRLLLTGPVREEIVKGHRCARSCTIFRDFSDKPSRAPGDSSTL